MNADADNNPTQLGLYEQLGKLEYNDDDNHEDEHQADGNQGHLAAATLFHNSTQLLLRCSQPALCHINILIQFIEQPLLQAQLLMNGEGNVLQPLEYSVSKLSRASLTTADGLSDKQGV